MLELQRADLERILPHRGRALLMNRARVFEEKKRAFGWLTIDDVICEGHFPGNPIMRGVDRIEMIALTVGLAAIESLPEGFLPYFVSCGKARFPSVARLGDVIRAEGLVEKVTKRVIKGSGKAYVEGRLVAEVENIICMFGKK